MTLRSCLQSALSVHIEVSAGSQTFRTQLSLFIHDDKNVKSIMMYLAILFSLRRFSDPSSPSGIVKYRSTSKSYTGDRPLSSPIPDLDLVSIANAVFVASS